ncbi:MAG: GGDEF domain-containing protein [Pantoea sp.]|uniref:GGDEF domain-containing protein n=2 Tax=Pantoea TaxID=53335 RepID=UPI0028FE273D|nr:GGDEF domain-containing protein [Pantoea sp.]MDU1572099.1 GGDEF domain-containing protein [Pantoea sp.]
MLSSATRSPSELLPMIKSILKTKNDKRLTFIVVFLVLFPVTAYILGSFSYLNKISNNSIDAITGILLHEQAVNDGIASMMSISAIPEVNLQKNSLNVSGVLYKNSSYSEQSYHKLRAISLIESYVSREILENRYYSSPKYGFVYFFNKDKYQNLKPEMYNDVVSLTGNFARFVSKKNLGGDFWDNHLSLNEIYKDAVTQKMVMTIASPVLSISTKEITGFFYSDLSEEELWKRVHSKIKIPTWLSITANNISQDRAGSLCVTKNCDANNLMIKLSSRPLADIFILESAVNVKTLIMNNVTFMLLTLLCFALLFIAFTKLAHLIIRVQRKAVIDPLTKVYNRQIIGYLSSASFNSLIIFDCDDFKIINDEFGHVVGDAALKHIASTISKNIRNEDVVIRYGGDEFIVLCTKEKVGAARMAERICNKIYAMPFEVDGLKLQLSLSYGVAHFCDNLQSALRSADEILYAHKAEKKERKSKDNATR